MLATVFLHLAPEDPVSVTSLNPGLPCVSVTVAWLQVFVQPHAAGTARRLADALNQAADQMQATMTPELEAFAAVEGDPQAEGA